MKYKGMYKADTFGPTEAVWRLFEYATHEENPTVIHLAIHLPGEQPVYFTEGINSAVLRIQMEQR